MAKFKHAFTFLDDSELSIDADIIETQNDWLRLIVGDKNDISSTIMVGVVNAALVKHVIITPIDTEKVGLDE